jgi:predicted small secreted protein
MKTLSVVAALLAAALSLVACNEDTGTVQPGAGEAVVEGTVTDALTDLPVVDVSVSAAGQSTLTTADGAYSLKFTVDSITTVTVSFAKSGYRDTLLIVQVRSNERRTVPMRLVSSRTVVGGTGIAQTIAFRGATPDEVSVYGVGGTETSLLAWEVRDSLGQPIDGDHAVDLSFSVVNGPGGGEYVSPSVVRTGLSGQAYTTLNAGTRSGVTQILASATVGGRSITSSPIRVIINGGFPVQSHFSIAATNYNFPGMDWMGRTLAVSILVGDVYSNPVAPNTAVYFRSSAGVVQPSVFTNEDGQGTVNLISGNPHPFGVYAAAAPLDTAYHYLVARTVGQGGVTVTDSILVLWSGRSQISNVTPTSFAIPNGGSQSFNFVVSDRYLHPLSPGTEIIVSASVPPPPDPNTPMNQVQLGFGVGGKVVLEDYLFRGPGSTDFSFQLSDGATNINQATIVTISINVKSPNGDTYFSFSGTAN